MTSQMGPHQRNTSHQSQQNLISKETSNDAAYMLKLSKYKKMKNELNLQTKSVLKKCLNGIPSDIQKSSSNQNTFSSLKNQQQNTAGSSQLNLNHIEHSSKENTNLAANTAHMVKNTPQTTVNSKAQTLKISINALLNEFGGQQMGQQTSQNKNLENQLQFNKQAPQKNHSIMPNNSNGQEQKKKLQSSKMMMALHKKCNSIMNGSNISMLNATQKISKNTSNASIIDGIGAVQEIQKAQKPLLSNHQNKKLNSSSQRYEIQIDSVDDEKTAALKKNASQISQIEFFDENVHANEVPQITPRHLKKKGLAQPNERYKNVDQPKSSKNQLFKPIVFSFVQNDQQNKENIMPYDIKLDKKQQQKNYQQREEPQKQHLFEQKRRSCGPSQIGENHGDIQHSSRLINGHSAIDVQNDLILSQRVNGSNAFTQRKYSQQVPNSGSNAQLKFKPEDIIKHYKQKLNQKSKQDPKEEIIGYISKYIKQNQNQSQVQCSKDSIVKEQKEYEEKIQNLKDFLQYLEDKKIINTKQLENNKEEMTNLIQDLMKLDLNKFNAKQGVPLQHPITCKGSPIANYHQDSQNIYQKRRNSADQLVLDPTPNNNGNQQFSQQLNSPMVNIEQKNRPNQQAGSQLPMNSPNPDNKLVCYYSPLNVNGNNNIVNTNVQIYPINPAVYKSKGKQFNCSQKLFMGDTNLEGSEGENLKKEEENVMKTPDLSNQQSPVMQQQQKVPQKEQYKQRVNSSNFQSNPPQKSNLVNQIPKQFQNSSSLQSNKSQEQEKIPMNPPHFYSRKQSMFVQGEIVKDYIKDQGQNNALVRNQKEEAMKGSNKILFNFQQQKIKYQEQLDSKKQKEDDEAIAVHQNNKVQHRRATTNFIQSSKQQSHQSLMQNQPFDSITPSQQQSIEAPVINDDIGMIAEREKLIKYIQLYTRKKGVVPSTSLDFYKFTKLIGKGAFGKVTLGIHKLTGKQVAIKTVDKSLMKDEYQRRKVLQEVHLLQKVRHTNVIRLLEVFESDRHLLMVMEHAGNGDLLQYVKKKKKLSETEARGIFQQIVYGTAHCHCRSVLHRDIKLDNILLDNDGEIKICDFGVSRVVQKNQKINEQCGTPAYIAPEIISDNGYQGFSADIWSLGVLLYAMVCGTVPFKAQNMHELHQIITKGYFSFPQNLDNQLSYEIKDLISQMLKVNVHERISIPEILSHMWLNDQTNTEEDFDYSMDLMQRGGGLTGDETGGDIDLVDIDNLFSNTSSFKSKLAYSDYISITQDQATFHIDEDALQVLEGYGFPRKMVKEGINKGELNHATASYNLLMLS